LCSFGLQKLDAEQMEELKEAFNLFDTDGNGVCMSGLMRRDWCVWCECSARVSAYGCEASESAI
jgi:hypothetical protein